MIIRVSYNAFWFGHFKEYTGRLTTGTFTYKDISGTQFVNTLPGVDTVAFPTSLDTLTKSQAYDMQWGGSPILADESVGIFIGSWTWGQDAAYLQTNDAANNVIFGTGQLSTLPVGPSTLYMDRAMTKTLAQKTTVGGTITAKYRARTKVVQVVN